MDFRGHLRLPDDEGTGIPVVLRVDDIYIVLSSEGEELGTWRADDVEIERIFSNQFAIDLAGEPMVFVAADALGFAYEGVSAITELQERLSKRRRLRRSKKKAKKAPQPAPAAAAAPEPPAEVRPVEAPSAQTESPAPATGFDESVAAAAQSPSVADSDDETRVPLFERRDSEPASAPSPIWTPPAAPASPSSEPGPPARDETAWASPPPNRGVPSPSAPSHHPEPAPEPEYEIEEVGAAASGHYDQPSTTPKPARDLEPELDIDEYVMPTAGVAETFVPVAPLPELDPEPERRVETESQVRAPDPATREADTPPARPERPEPFWSRPQPAPEPRPVPEPTAAPVELGSNGHADIEELATDEPGDSARDGSGRKVSLFGRSKSKKEPEHEHRFGPPKTLGGLTRSVCEICGHVTFSGEDVYQDW